MPDQEPDFSALQAAYRELPEELKRAILRHMVREDRGFLEDLMSRAGLARGFRPKAVAERGDPRVRTKVDEALVGAGNEVMLAFAAKRLFLFLRPDFVRQLNEEAIAQKKVNDFDAVGELLARLEPGLGATKGWSFFAAAARLAPETYLLPPALLGVDSTEADAENWSEDLQNLEEQCATLTAGVARLTAAQEVSGEELHAALDSALLTAALLRAEMAKAAAESGFSADAWEDAASLRAYASALTAHRQAAVAQREALAAHLEARRVHHRVPRQQERLEALRTGAVAQLRAAPTAGNAPGLPGPADAAQWLDWAFARTGGEIEELHERLTGQGLAALAELLESCEAAELGSKDSPEPALTPAAGPAPEAAPSPTPPVGSPGGGRDFPGA